MTLDEIRNCPKDYLIPADVAPVLGCDAQDIRVAAKRCPERLGFNVCVIGSRVKIPRMAFLRWMEGRKGDYTHEEAAHYTQRREYAADA